MLSALTEVCPPCFWLSVTFANKIMPAHVPHVTWSSRKIHSRNTSPILFLLMYMLMVVLSPPGMISPSSMSVTCAAVRTSCTCTWTPAGSEAAARVTATWCSRNAPCTCRMPMWSGWAEVDAPEGGMLVRFPSFCTLEITPRY